MGLEFLSALAPDMASLVQEAIEAANDIADKHGAGGGCVYDAPEIVKDAHALLVATREIDGAQQCGDWAKAIEAALFVGMAIPNIVTAANDTKGRSLEEICDVLRSGGRPNALTDDEKIKAKLAFQKSKDAGNTNNAAARCALREINQSRIAPVNLSTIERTVGIRQ